MNNKALTSIVLTLTFMVILSCSCTKELSSEHEEARNVEIKVIDFSKLRQGKYQGYYPGGMYGWRENECKIAIDTINNGKSLVVNIELISSESDYTQEFLDTLYNRVIRAQSLQVDACSGATLDSKACLKAVEDALIKAEK